MGVDKKRTCAIVSDWIVILLLGIGYFIMDGYMKINWQCIAGPGSPNTCNIQGSTPFLAYPYKKSDVPVYYPYLFGFTTWLAVIVISLIIQICYVNHLALNKYDAQTILVKIESLFREVLTSVIITASTVLWIKKYVGRPRPIFYEYYKINPNDALESFPSGHASSSFCIHILLIYHVMYAMYWSYNNMDKKIELNNINSLFGAKFWKATRYHNGFKVFCILLLLVLPILISCSRITEYYHNYSDVICGALIGTGISSIVFVVFNNELYYYSSSESI